ncbi:helix-turn-helix domain-containing protein [Roseibium aestuarii]|uniref:Helix-turn-helix domain-containing protein n=1 Tax=Roseibium aestuarii TaxID=2600299 RepID=A0ABW4JXK7_9HYPH|nr:helix-turn-helix transcriptional regulator [Roseibium aestuarii]
MSGERERPLSRLMQAEGAEAEAAMPEAGPGTSVQVEMERMVVDAVRVTAAPSGRDTGGRESGGRETADRLEMFAAIERLKSDLGALQALMRSGGAVAAPSVAPSSAPSAIPSDAPASQSAVSGGESVAAARPAGLSVQPLETDAPGGLGSLVAAVRKEPEADRAYHARGAQLDFGRFLRQRRKKAGLSLEQLAERAGTSVAQLSLIERGTGKRGPTLDLMGRLLWALDLTLRFDDGG